MSDSTYSTSNRRHHRHSQKGNKHTHSDQMCICTGFREATTRDHGQTPYLSPPPSPYALLPLNHQQNPSVRFATYIDLMDSTVKAKATPAEKKNPDSSVGNSQITDAVFKNDKGEYKVITNTVFENDKSEYKVRVVKQILWVNGIRYELQENYGIGNSVDGDYDGNDPVYVQ
ncbi:hypothetical protein L2E82_27901 [Cichorium intybus]|uniref:Uncharacterized protein n=1 Tax=Cichorium intybus TaxID=13427 RepID=A0ACB9CUJ6_CICIN|nr:hypothetical protein L2E82_27901 [Cichorium intybus]